MNRTSLNRWMARHPVICALIFAVGMGLGPTVRLANRPSLFLGVMAMLGVTMGAGFGWLFSLIARKGADGP